MQPGQNFQSFYNTTLRPQLVEIDTQRQAVVDIIKLYGAIGIGGGLVLLFFNAGMFPLIIVGAGLYFFYHHHAKAYRETYKQKVILTMITAAGLNYDHNSRIQQSEYEKSKLFLKKIKRYYGDDYVHGVVGKTAIRLLPDSIPGPRFRSSSRETVPGQLSPVKKPAMAGTPGGWTPSYQRRRLPLAPPVRRRLFLGRI